MSWGKNYVVRPLLWVSPFWLFFIAYYFGVTAEKSCRSSEPFFTLLCGLFIVFGILVILGIFLSTFNRIPITIGKMEKHVFENYLVIVAEGNKFFKYERGIDSEYYDYQKFTNPEAFVLLRGQNSVFVTCNYDEKLGLRMYHNVKGIIT